MKSHRAYRERSRIPHTIGKNRGEKKLKKKILHTEEGEKKGVEGRRRSIFSPQWSKREEEDEEKKKKKKKKKKESCEFADGTVHRFGKCTTSSGGVGFSWHLAWELHCSDVHQATLQPLGPSPEGLHGYSKVH
ncbi:hypothetical protein CEXT_108791 [Caerostris extrusa]|uniref:Uncharacterized protein n=1 Tax=Caerostris extrusa TaxID=172846 RepID=A0AAV4PBN4_CAEEX|nr:hypothetical protein CEXT_108791 [Caerostris extrusa]